MELNLWALGDRTRDNFTAQLSQGQFTSIQPHHSAWHYGAKGGWGAAQRDRGCHIASFKLWTSPRARTRFLLPLSPAGTLSIMSHTTTAAG